MQTWQVHCGDALSVLKTLPDKSVDCVVTSPPYFGLRDYGHEGQVGLEDSPQAYVSSLVAVFAECRSVLVDEGTMWINLGDSYSAAPAGNAGKCEGLSSSASEIGARDKRRIGNGIKTKDLIGIPWSVAFALRADGWYLRSEIIWHKKSCMPESVKDRPTKAHEQVFLLTKQARYFYDADAIREKYAMTSWTAESDRAGKTVRGKKGTRSGAKMAAVAEGAADGARRGATSLLNAYDGDGKNARTVWDEEWESRRSDADNQMLISEDMERFPQFETYDGEGQKDYAAAGVQNPSAVKARILHKSKMLSQDTQFAQRRMKENRDAKRAAGAPINQEFGCGANARSVWSLGPEPATDIDHFAVMPKTLARRCILAGCPFGGTVLDPFAGSGTTGIVALEEGRSFIGIELNEKYHAISRQRLANTAPLLAQEGSLSAMFQP